MKTLISFLVASLFATSVFAQDTLVTIAYTSSAHHYFSFEHDDTTNYFFIDTAQSNNIWQMGTPVKATFDTALAGTSAMVTDTANPYPVNNLSSFQLVVYSDDHTIFELLHRYDTDASHDGGVVEVSSNGGVTWYNVADDPFLYSGHFGAFYTVNDSLTSNPGKIGFSGNSNGWLYSQFDPGPMSYYVVRFTFTSDSIFDNRDGWMIDSFSVTCVGTGVKQIVQQNFHLFPNPASDNVNVTAAGHSLEKVTLYDVNGIRVLVRAYPTVIQVAGLNPGLYFAHIETATCNETVPLLISR
jgi:hypothetical protein